MQLTIEDINPNSYHNLTKSIKCSYSVDFDELIKFERKINLIIKTVI